MIWNIWRCPGGICPELKTDDMTQPVGVDKNGKLWTEPTTIPEELTQEVDDLSHAVVDISDDVDDLDYRVTALENAPAAGGNAYVTSGAVSALSGNAMQVQFENLPTGAVIDKIVWQWFISGGTIPRNVVMYPYMGGLTQFVSTSDGSNNGYALWDIEKTAVGTTHTNLKATLASNTLYTTLFNTTGDAVSWVQIYYHI